MLNSIHTPAAAAAPGLAYLVSEYPGISHTFILREVMRLRTNGTRIDVASINRPHNGGRWMTDAEQAEAERTYYVKAHGLLGALGGLLHGLMHPLALMRSLALVFTLGGADPRRTLLALFYLVEALMLARWMEKRNHTHLHVHFATAAASVGLILKRFSGITLSMTVHGPDEFYDAPGQWLTRKIEACDFVVCISQFARSQIMKLSGDEHWHKFHVCPLGVDVSTFTPEPPRIQGTFTVLCVGRLTPAKGQRILLGAMRRLQAQGRTLKLVVVGDGPDAQSLRAAVTSWRLGDCVTFTGALNQTQVRKHYRKADIFALPSFAEGVPVVLMEAMACALPCITTRITGIPELIADGQSGVLVPPSDEDALAGAIAQLMDDPQLRHRIGAQGREQVKRHYDLDTNVSRLMHIFSEQLRQRRTAHTRGASLPRATGAFMEETP